MYELPKWSKRLTNYYCALRVSKRNKALRRAYYRKIAVEKLVLAEAGINQEKIKAVCRYLVNQDCMRGANLKSCSDLAGIWIKPDNQLVLRFHKNHHSPPDT